MGHAATIGIGACATTTGITTTPFFASSEIGLRERRNRYLEPETVPFSGDKSRFCEDVLVVENALCAETIQRAHDRIVLNTCDHELFG